MIGGIVLAAGLSERMAGPVPKQLLTVGGRAMVSVVAGNAAQSDLDRVVVVTGYYADQVAQAVAGEAVEVAENARYRDGNMTSLRTGYEALGYCDAYVIMLADMPGVTAEIINRLVACWEKMKPWAAVSCYEDGTGHPLLLSAAAMAAGAKGDEEHCLWRFLNAEQHRVEEVEFAIPKPPDVNTPDAYEALDDGEISRP